MNTAKDYMVDGLSQTANQAGKREANGAAGGLRDCKPSKEAKGAAKSQPKAAKRSTAQLLYDGMNDQRQDFTITRELALACLRVRPEAFDLFVRLGKGPKPTEAGRFKALSVHQMMCGKNWSQELKVLRSLSDEMDRRERLLNLLSDTKIEIEQLYREYQAEQTKNQEKEGALKPIEDRIASIEEDNSNLALATLKYRKAERERSAASLYDEYLIADGNPKLGIESEEREMASRSRELRDQWIISIHYRRSLRAGDIISLLTDAAPERYRMSNRLSAAFKNGGHEVSAKIFEVTIAADVNLGRLCDVARAELIAGRLPGETLTAEFISAGVALAALLSEERDRMAGDGD
jgi:hypothetical protein